MNISNMIIKSLYFALLAILFSSGAWAGSKPTLSLGFYVQGDKFEGPRMVRPESVAGQELYFRVVPIVSHQNVQAFYPFTAADGSFGVALRVNETGWRGVREAGSVDAGKLLLVRVNGRPVQAMRIDNPKVDDYTVIIWKGITEAEVGQLRKTFRELASEGAGSAGAEAAPVPEEKPKRKFPFFGR